MPPEYNGIYSFNKLNDSPEGNRPVYQKNGKCVWWHRQYRHWWIGPCENVGMNTGYAYVKEDSDCPSYENTWRRGGSDEFLHNVHVSLIYFDRAPAAPAIPSGGGILIWSAVSAGVKSIIRTTATAGVNSIFRNGWYKHICQPVYRHGRPRCQKIAKRPIK
jgi:hypothetical protein